MEKYLAAEIEIISFDSEDVITTSSPDSVEYPDVPV
jgi:hypothetical protein